MAEILYTLKDLTDYAQADGRKRIELPEPMSRTRRVIDSAQSGHDLEDSPTPAVSDNVPDLAPKAGESAAVRQGDTGELWVELNEGPLSIRASGKRADGLVGILLQQRERSAENIKPTPTPQDGKEGSSEPIDHDRIRVQAVIAAREMIALRENGFDSAYIQQQFLQLPTYLQDPVINLVANYERSRAAIKKGQLALTPAVTVDAIDERVISGDVDTETNATQAKKVVDPLPSPDKAAPNAVQRRRALKVATKILIPIVLLTGAYVGPKKTDEAFCGTSNNYNAHLVPCGIVDRIAHDTKAQDLQIYKFIMGKK